MFAHISKSMNLRELTNFTDFASSQVIWNPTYLIRENLQSEATPSSRVFVGKSSDTLLSHLCNKNLCFEFLLGLLKLAAVIYNSLWTFFPGPELSLNPKYEQQGFVTDLRNW